MGRCKRYWYEVVDAFLNYEKAYHRRGSEVHDRSMVWDTYASYELCGNEIARLALDGKMLYIRTTGWHTHTTMTRLGCIVPRPLCIHARAPKNYIEYLYISDDRFDYLLPNYEFLGIDMTRGRIAGLFDSQLKPIGRPSRVVPYIRKPKTKADQYYRIIYSKDGSVDKVLIKNGDDLMLLVPKDGFVGVELISTLSVVDFVESDSAMKKLIGILRDNRFFSNVVEKISEYLVAYKSDL